MNDLINLIPFFTEIVCLCIWLRGLWKWDGTDECNCDEKECKTCPFPCEKHNKHT